MVQALVILPGAGTEVWTGQSTDELDAFIAARLGTTDFFVSPQEKRRVAECATECETECATKSAVPCSVQVQLRLRGGKGGFGQMLRSQKGKTKTYDYGAMRDLSGRRLRHIDQQQALTQWQQQQEQGRARGERPPSQDEISARFREIKELRLPPHLRKQGPAQQRRLQRQQQRQLRAEQDQVLHEKRLPRLRSSMAQSVRLAQQQRLRKKRPRGSTSPSQTADHKAPVKTEEPAAKRQRRSVEQEAPTQEETPPQEETSQEETQQEETSQEETPQEETQQEETSQEETPQEETPVTELVDLASLDADKCA
ncbi:MAG: hypothetical protein MHM6MM_008221, partial [Cercozoa sp. M6MM]